MSEREQYYDLQPSFNSGVISPDVATRTDLDKFRSALLRANNCFIRPYGAVYRRPGTAFVASTKYADKKCLLKEFSFTSKISYLLEIGEKYIRIYKDNVYMGVEVATPFTEDELVNLRFAQSGDTVFIASGTHNVQLLQRFGEQDWRIKEMDLTSPYFDLAAMNSGTSASDPSEPTVIRVDTTYSATGAFYFTAPISGVYTITLAGGGGGGVAGYADPRYDYYYQAAYGGKAIVSGTGGKGELKTITMYLMQGQVYNGYINANGGGVLLENVKSDVSKTAGSGGSVSFNSASASGGPGASMKFTFEFDEIDQEHGQFAWDCFASATNGSDISSNGQSGGYYTWSSGPTPRNYVYHAASQGYVRIQINASAGTGSTVATDGIASSSKTGTTRITSSTSGVFTANMVGGCIKLWHNIPSQSLSLTASNTQTSTAIVVGKSWKIITHGTWGGDVYIQTSTDGTVWKEYRRYTSSSDYNVTESGTVDEHTYFRIYAAISSGTCRIDFTALPYTHEGYAQITAYNSDTDVMGNVIKAFGSTEATKTYAFSVWSPEFGYPKCVGFFQDRLVLASNTRYPYGLWMSRSGDYYNFSVEKADGTVTDDSAIMVSLVNRKEYQIKHIVASSDLIIFTDGNEWLISGSETVTPSKCTPKVQSSRGCEDVLPLTIGGRIVYVQRRGTTVRDFAYSFDTDNYDGADLTILAKHLTRDNPLVDSAYEQDPDSMLYFVTSDGKINCLTYVADQKVYAWSQLTTQGSFESVANVTSGTRDIIYTVVKRELNGTTVRCIEYFTDYPESEDPMDYTMLDSAQQFIADTATHTLTGFTRFAGCDVSILAGGKAYKKTVGSNGTITLPEAVTKAIVGLPYTTEIEQPNIELPSNNGTQQGRFKKVSEAILKLTRSYGGSIGDSPEFTDDIKYEDDGLFTGELRCTIPNQPVGGYEKYGRIYIKTDEPYPFDISSLVRVVTFGG